MPEIRVLSQALKKPSPKPERGESFKNFITLVQVLALQGGEIALGNALFFRQYLLTL
jgi:hypothetical protein